MVQESGAGAAPCVTQNLPRRGTPSCRSPSLFHCLASTSFVAFLFLFSITRDPHRFPSEIAEAQCRYSGCINAQGQEDSSMNSVAIHQEILVLRREPQGCSNSFRLEKMRVKVGCTCVTPIVHRAAWPSSAAADAVEEAEQVPLFTQYSAWSLISKSSCFLGLLVRCAWHSWSSVLDAMLTSWRALELWPVLMCSDALNFWKSRRIKTPLAQPLYVTWWPHSFFFFFFC